MSGLLAPDEQFERFPGAGAGYASALALPPPAGRLCWLSGQTGPSASLRAVIHVSDMPMRTLRG